MAELLYVRAFVMLCVSQRLRSVDRRKQLQVEVVATCR